MLQKGPITALKKQNYLSALKVCVLVTNILLPYKSVFVLTKEKYPKVGGLK